MSLWMPSRNRTCGSGNRWTSREASAAASECTAKPTATSQVVPVKGRRELIVSRFREGLYWKEPSLLCRSAVSVIAFTEDEKKGGSETDFVLHGDLASRIAVFATSREQSADKNLRRCLGFVELFDDVVVLR